MSRQEIAERIWGKGKYIEAEDGINTVIRKIRRAIDDNADEPHYIQTLVGRGYQFIGDVKDVEDGGKIAGEGSCPLLRMVFHNGKAGVIQIDEDITRITFPAVRLNVNVAALLVAHAQKSQFNGSLGRIRKIIPMLAEGKPSRQAIECEFDGALHRFAQDSLDRIELAHAITVHKAQGASLGG